VRVTNFRTQPSKTLGFVVVFLYSHVQLSPGDFLSPGLSPVGPFEALIQGYDRCQRNACDGMR
jgi:hypothetical protein